jgi:hypothetical protein
MPTETDAKIAADLADFRAEVAERFGKLEAGIAERFGKAEAGIAERFGKADAQFAAIETELRIIRKLGPWLLGGVFGLVATLITGAATIGWAASSVNSKVEQQGARLGALENQVGAMDKKLDSLENRVDAIDKKLDTLISRTAPRAGG